VERYGTVGQASDNNTIWLMGIACWINKAINTYSEYATLIVFHGNSGFTNAPQCYVYTHVVCLVVN